MFRRFYPQESAAEAERFSEQALTAHTELSAAQVQGHFMLYKTDAAGSIKNIAEVKEWSLYIQYRFYMMQTEQQASDK